VRTGDFRKAVCLRIVPRKRWCKDRVLTQSLKPGIKTAISSRASASEGNIAAFGRYSELFSTAETVSFQGGGLARISHREPKTVAPASSPAVRRVSRPSEISQDLEFLLGEPCVRNAD
jgi:hypothetical protein